MRKMKRILITGGAGFLGSQLANRLEAESYQVVLLDLLWPTSAFKDGPERQEQAICFTGDILDYALLNDVVSRYEVDAIVHLATWLTADCQRDPIGAVEVNCLGTTNIFTLAARNLVRRVIFGSSVAVFAADPALPTGDSRPYGPSSVYGATKLFAEQLAVTMRATQSDLDIVGLRFGWIYGPGRVRGWNDMQAVIEGFALEQPLVKYPDYQKANDWTYVDDAVEAIVRCLNLPSSSTAAFNVSGDYRPIQDAINHLSRRFPDIRSEPYSAELPAVGWNFTSDAITKETGFYYRISLEGGLDRTVNSLRSDHGLSPIC